MEMTLSTPALLFPAISLLLLAYTNRFLAISARIRNLHAESKVTHSPGIARQIDTLRRRIYLIRNMQLCGVLSIFLCVLCMFVLFAGHELAGRYLFGMSLLLLLVSLTLSLREIHLSVRALDVQLSDYEQ